MRLLAQGSHSFSNLDGEAILTTSIHVSSFNVWDPLRVIQENKKTMISNIQSEFLVYWYKHPTRDEIKQSRPEFDGKRFAQRFHNPKCDGSFTGPFSFKVHSHHHDNVLKGVGKEVSNSTLAEALVSSLGR